MSSARFKIRNLTTGGAWSGFDDAGFDANAGDELELQLEDSPALDIYQTVFSCSARSSGRTLPVFDPASGEPTTPTSAITMTLPAGEVGTWAIQAQTNGGVSVLDAQGRADAAVNTKVRFVAVRTAELNLRHPLDGERSEYEPGAGYAVSLQELIDACDAANAGAGVPTTRAFATMAPLRIDGAASADLSADRTLSITLHADGGITVTGNALQLGTLGFARVADALAAASADIAVNSQQITGLAAGVDDDEAVNVGQLNSAIAAIPGGLDAATAVLEDTATALNANGVPIRALPSTLSLISTVAQPLGLQWNDASTDSVLTVLDLRRLSSGTAAIGIGPGLSFTGQDDAGDEPTLGYISAYLTDATGGSHASKVGFGAATAGALVENVVTLDGDGNLVAMGSVTCSNGATIRKSGIATTTTTGVTAQNATAATSGVPVQKGPVVDSTGSAWDTDDSVSRTVKSGWYVEPRSGTTVGYYVRLAIDAGAGSWTNSELYYTNSDPALFGTALVGGTFLATANGYRLYTGSTSRGGMNVDGSNNVRIVASTTGAGVVLYAGSTNRLLVESTGQKTTYLDATAYCQRQWTSARYQRTYNAVVTTTNGTALNVTAAQIRPGDGSVVDIDLRAQAYEAATKDQRRWRVMGGAQVESGASAIDGATAIDDTTNDGVNTVAWNATVVASSADIIPQVQGEDLKTITWSITVTYTVYVP